MQRCVDEILKENSQGVEMCMRVVLACQLTEGSWRARPRACNLHEEVSMYSGYNKLRVAISADLPERVMLDVLLLRVILRNVIDNAKMVSPSILTHMAACVHCRIVPMNACS